MCRQSVLCLVLGITIMASSIYASMVNVEHSGTTHWPPCGLLHRPAAARLTMSLRKLFGLQVA
jgi:hypothetical protein